MTSSIVNMSHKNEEFVPMGFARQEYWSGSPLPSPEQQQQQHKQTLTHHNHPKSTVYLGFILFIVHILGLNKDIMTCMYCYNTVCFQCSKTPLCPTCSSLQPSSLAPLIFLLSPQFCLFQSCHIIGIIQYVIFSDWHLSCSNKHLSFLHVFVWLKSFFLFSAEYHSIVQVYKSSFIHSPTERHFDGFCMLAYE